MDFPGFSPTCGVSTAAQLLFRNDISLGKKKNLVNKSGKNEEHTRGL